MRSGYNVTEETVRDSFWAYAEADIFVPSAIPADTSRQNFTVFPRGYYVDMLKYCRDCKRKFIFFAVEQKHWFEELGFYIDADCVRCVECRANDRIAQQRFHRYSRTINKDDLSDEALAILIEDSVFLWNIEMVRNENSLRRLKNLANKRIPDHEAALEINSIVESINSEDQNAV